MKNLLDLIKILSKAEGLSFCMYPKQKESLAEFVNQKITGGVLTVKGVGFEENIYDVEIETGTINNEIKEHGFAAMIIQISLLPLGDPNCETEGGAYLNISVHQDGHACVLEGIHGELAGAFSEKFFTKFISRKAEDSNGLIQLINEIVREREKLRISKASAKLI